MRRLSPFLILALCATAAVAQDRSNTSTSRPNTSNFGWQEQERQAEEMKAKYLLQLAELSAAEWQRTALASVKFESGAEELRFTDAIRIGRAEADKKAKTEAEDGAWRVRFGKKTPQTLTLTLTDPNSTQVECAVDELLETGSGSVGVFVVEALLVCTTRAADAG